MDREPLTYGRDTDLIVCFDVSTSRETIFSTEGGHDLIIAKIITHFKDHSICLQLHNTNHHPINLHSTLPIDSPRYSLICL